MSDNYSYSKLDTYQQCPFKFKLRYIDGNYVHSDSINTEIGTAIHSCEEQIALAIKNNQPIDYVQIKNQLILKMFELQTLYPVELFELDKSNRTFADKIYWYLQTGIYRLEQYMKAHPTYIIAGAEQQFKIIYKNKQTFGGFIDRIFYDTATNTYIIQDIKTYAVPVEEDKLTTPLQFVIYTLAVQELYNCDPSKIKCQYYLPFCDLTQDAGTSSYLKRGITKLDKLFNSIESNDFTPNPCPLCNWCEFSKTNPAATEDFKLLCPYCCKWDRQTRNRADINNVENIWQGLENHDLIMTNYLKENKGEVK